MTNNVTHNTIKLPSGESVTVARMAGNELVLTVTSTYGEKEVAENADGYRRDLGVLHDFLLSLAESGRIMRVVGAFDRQAQKLLAKHNPPAPPKGSLPWTRTQVEAYQYSKEVEAQVNAEVGPVVTRQTPLEGTSYDPETRKITLTTDSGMLHKIVTQAKLYAFEKQGEIEKRLCEPCPEGMNGVEYEARLLESLVYYEKTLRYADNLRQIAQNACRAEES